MKFLEVYILFWIFSFLGWVMEIAVCSIDEKKIVNRGFLLGPYCPIYGFGGMVTLLLTPYKDYPIVCFVMSMIICSIVEYIASYLLEKLFRIRWWDYSNDNFNINGRICLRNAIAFGILGLLFTSYINPFFLNYINMLSDKSIIIISIIIFLITLIDIIVSYKAIDNIQKIISKNIDSLKNRDATNDIKNMIRETLLNNRYLERRIIKAYRYFEYRKKELRERILDVNDKIRKNSYNYFICVLLFGLTLGIFIGFITQYYRFWIIICLMFSVLIDIIGIRKRGD